MKKNKTSDRMSITEILLLIILLLCYFGTVVTLVAGLRAPLILLFVLYSCVSMVFLLVSYDRMTRVSLKRNERSSLPPEDELQMMSQYRQENVSLKQERDTLSEEKDTLTAKCTELEQKVASLTTSLEQVQTPVDKSELLSELLPQEETPVDLNIIDVVNKVMEEMAPYGRRAGIQLLLSSASDRLMVRADASFIRILFRNIIDNSIKYMHRNGNLVITVSNIGDDLFIVLKDNGEGLPTNETDHIFELNYQGSNRVSGNGLGLTQAKAIVEYYGGTIYAKSNSGKGMGIYIQLPASGR